MISRLTVQDVDRAGRVGQEDRGVVALRLDRLQEVGRGAEGKATVFE